MMKRVFALLIGVILGSGLACKQTKPTGPDPDPKTKVEKKTPKTSGENFYVLNTALSADSTFAIPQWKGKLAAMDISTDGTLGVADDSTLHLWDPKGGKSRGAISLKGPVKTLHSASPQWLTTSEKGVVHLYSPQGKASLKVKGTLAAIDSNRSQAALYQGKKQVAIYSLASNKVIHKQEISATPRRFVFGQKWFVTLGTDGVAYLWERNQWRLQTKFSGSSPTSIAVTPQEGHLITGGKVLTFWDIYSSEKEKTLQVSSSLRKLSISPDGTVVAGAGADGAIYLWDLKKHRSLVSLKANLGDRGDFVFLPDNRSILAVDESGQGKVWKFPSPPSNSTGLAGGIFFLEAKKHFAEGKKYESQENWKAAQQSWKKALEFSPGYEEARAKLQTLVVKQFNQIHRRYEAKGPELLKKGKGKELLKLCDQLLSFDAQNLASLQEKRNEVKVRRLALAEYLKGEALMAKEDFVQARQAYQSAIRIDPSFKEAREREELAWKKNYLAQQAPKKGDANKVAKKDPKKGESNGNQVVAKVNPNKKKPEEKKPEEKKPEEKKPEEKKPEEKKPTEKKPEKKKPTEKKPEEKVDPKTKVDPPVVVKKKDPPKPQVTLVQKKMLYNRALELLGRKGGEKSRAVEILSDLIEMDYRAAECHSRLAELHFAGKRYNKAKKHAYKALRTYSQSIKLHLILARSHRFTKNWHQARQAYNRVLQISPKSFDTLVEMIQVGKALNDDRVLDRTYTQLLQLQPGKAKWWNARFAVRKRLAEKDRAYQGLLAADLRQLAQREDRYYLDLGALNLKMNEPDRAKEVWGKGWKLARGRGDEALVDQYETRLKDAGYLYIGDRWQVAKDYYESQGLEKFGDRWVTPLEKKLLKRQSGIKGEVGRPPLAQITQAVSKHQLLLGMNREELVQCLGFWKDLAVIRNKDRVFEVLHFPKKKRYVYLVNGRVFAWE